VLSHCTIAYTMRLLLCFLNDMGATSEAEREMCLSEFVNLLFSFS